MKRCVLTGAPGAGKTSVLRALHEQVYREHGFDLVRVPAETVASRAAAISTHITGQDCQR